MRSNRHQEGTGRERLEPWSRRVAARSIGFATDHGTFRRQLCQMTLLFGLAGLLPAAALTPVPPADARQEAMARFELLVTAARRATVLDHLAHPDSAGLLARLTERFDPALARRVHRELSGEAADRHRARMSRLIDQCFIQLQTVLARCGPEQRETLLTEVAARAATTTANHPALAEVLARLCDRLHARVSHEILHGTLGDRPVSDGLAGSGQGDDLGLLARAAATLAAQRDRLRALAAERDGFAVMRERIERRADDLSVDWVNGDDDDAMVTFLDDRIWTVIDQPPIAPPAGENAGHRPQDRATRAAGHAPGRATATVTGLSPAPQGFLWGVSTSGYQWEGGNDASCWTRFEQTGKVPDRCGMAADGFHRYPTDIGLARGLGVNSFRLSIEWSRIEPRRGQIDPAAIAFYHRVLGRLHLEGLTPVVTLCHFTHPQWLDDELGGWEDPRSVEAFARFVTLVAREYGREIDWYLTFNEPTVFIGGGYVQGQLAPGKTSPIAAAKVTRHFMAAHRRAYAIIHENDPEARVSFNNYVAAYTAFGLPGGISFEWQEAADREPTGPASHRLPGPSSPPGRTGLAATTANGWAGVPDTDALIREALGETEAAPDQAAGISGTAPGRTGSAATADGTYDTRSIVSSRKAGPAPESERGQSWDRDGTQRQIGTEAGRRSDRRPARRRTLDYIGIDYYCRWQLLPYRWRDSWDWEIFPEGLTQALSNYHRAYRLPVLIAENGMATPGLAPRRDGWTREAFLVAHVAAMQRAMAAGVPVLGYFCWSITDNYEWGTWHARFGLYSLDGKQGDLTRRPTPSAKVYRDLVTHGGVTPMLQRGLPPAVHPR